MSEMLCYSGSASCKQSSMFRNRCSTSRQHRRTSSRTPWPTTTADSSCLRKSSGRFLPRCCLRRRPVPRTSQLSQSVRMSTKVIQAVLSLAVPCLSSPQDRTRLPTVPRPQTGNRPDLDDANFHSQPNRHDNHPETTLHLPRPRSRPAYPRSHCLPKTCCREFMG